MSKELIHVEQSTVAVASPGAKEAKTLGELYEAAQNGMRRVVALGLFAHEIKSRLKHGQFGLWLKEHAPHLSREVNGIPAPSTSLAAYMQLSYGVLEAAGYKLGRFLAETANFQTLEISHRGEILTLQDSDVPEEVKPLRNKLCALIDGKTQRQLFAEFKTAEDDGEDLKVGSALGKHHPRKAKPPTAEEQLKAKMQHEEELIDIVIADMRLAMNTLLRTARPKAIQDGLNAGTEWTALMRQLLKAEKQARKRSVKPKPLLNAQPKQR